MHGRGRKFMKQKKGFTLTELLATILILAILIIIAVPNILTYVEKTKMEKLRSTASFLIDGIEHYAIEHIAELRTSGLIEFTILDYKFSGGGYQMQGDMPLSGTISITDDQKVFIAVTDGKYCAKKGVLDKDIDVSTDLDGCGIY